MADASGVITTAVNMYTTAFGGYMHRFLEWGEWFFYSSLVIAIVWMCLWRAFDSNSFQDSMPEFLKEFFVIAFFYTIMLNAGPWLGSIMQTAVSMGTAFTGNKVDPSSIISQGITIANLLIAPAGSTSIFANFFGAIISAIAYIVVFFAFVSIALELAVTIIATTFFISISGLLLSFAVFPFTRTIARRALDIVLANSMKMLALYVVIAAGAAVFTSIQSYIPQGTVGSFDIYGWVMAAAILFWLVSKNIPSQLARIFSESIQEARGTDAPALAMAAMRYTKMATPTSKNKPAAGGAIALSQIAGNKGHSALAQFNSTKGEGIGMSGVASMSSGSGGVSGGLSDHFKHLNSKLAEKKSSTTASFAERSAASSDQKSPSTADISNSKNSAGAPSSSGMKAAGMSKTRSTPKASSPKKK